jgi:hypothetical protein
VYSCGCAHKDRARKLREKVEDLGQGLGMYYRTSRKDDPYGVIVYTAVTVNTRIRSPNTNRGSFRTRSRYLVHLSVAYTLDPP